MTPSGCTCKWISPGYTNNIIYFPLLRVKTVKVLLRLFWSQSDVRPITVFPSDPVTPSHIPSAHLSTTLNSWNPDTVWGFRSRKPEVSPRHTSQHKQFGARNVVSIPPDTRQMLLLLCHFNISQQLENLCDPGATRMSTNDRTVGKEQRICYRWQEAVMDPRGERPQSSRLQRRSLRSGVTRQLPEVVLQVLILRLTQEHENCWWKVPLKVLTGSNIIIYKSNPLLCTIIVNIPIEKIICQNVLPFNQIIIFCFY